MKQPNIVFRFLFPADKNSAKTIKPTMGSLNNPAAGLFPYIYPQFFGLNTPGFYVCGILEFLNKPTHLIKIISFIKAEVLSVVRSWFRTFDGNTLERRPCQFHIVPVCSVHGKANRNPGPIAQHRSLHTCFTPISRVFSCFPPHLEGLWSSLHPWLAISSQDPADRHIPAVRFSKTEGIRLLAPIPGIVHVRLNQSIYLLHQGLSIGTLFLKQIGYHSLPFDRLPAFCPPPRGWVFTGTGSSGSILFQSSSEIFQRVAFFLISCFSPAASLP